uniref:von Willebrand factor A domain containing 5A n=1 Tax=Xiphophorus couchianus TaxID=32473 RepID=A0A3B5KUR1_9TELE
MSNLCCLLTAEKDSVPLKSIDVLLEVKDHVATLVSTLNFENKEDKPLETVFVFPLPGDAAVCHFSAQIGETHIVAEVMDRQQARQVYDDAVSSGQKVFELEESDESPDIFSLTVGNLPPGESASIRLEYVTELAVQADDGLRFCLPVVLNPRYQPQGPSVQVTSVPASLVPYSLSFFARVSSPRPISKIESSCPLEPLQYLNADQTQATVKLATGHKFDRDIELLIYYKDTHRPSAVVEAGQASAKPGTLMGDPVVMVSLYPEFPESVMSNFNSCGEFVFLLDRSGSMDFPTYCGSRQSRIASAKDTLMLLLKSLPMGCYFNIYGFGDHYEHVFPKSAKYNQKNLKRALKRVEEMDANLGGSEILEPLRQIYRQPCIPKHPRQLFIFTDGEVNYTKAVLDEVKEYSEFHRCFSFGIGEGASSELINGMAREGGGHAQFIIGKERMQPKVMQSLRFALQPLVTDISLSWDLPEGVSATALSPPLTALFQGQRSLIFAQLNGECSEAADGCLTVRFTTAGHPCQNQLHFSLQPACDLDFDLKEDMLAARTLIRSLEQEQREHGKLAEEIEKVVDLSVQSGVSSIFTAFIAVDKSNGEPVRGPLIYRENPTYKVLLLVLPVSWQECNVFYLMVCNSLLFSGTVPLLRGGLIGLMFDDLWADKNRDCGPTKPAREPLLELVSLQDASGCWLLDPCLAAALGKSTEELVKTRPSSVGWLWGTILALIWLHGYQKDVKVEWELLAMKAASWLRAEKAVCVTVCVEAGNVLLGCNVTTDALGL